MTDWLNYWKWSSIADDLDDGWVYTHAGSEQLRRAREGDTLWTVSVSPRGRLILVGRLRVELIAESELATQVVGADELWESSLHAIAAPAMAERVRAIDLGDIAAALRFDSANDRLRVEGGRVDARQLQTMRRLTAASAAMLCERWERRASRGRGARAAQS